MVNSRGARGDKLGDLTTADLIVISLLEERAMHGYDLLGEYERQEVVDWASVSKAQIYYALQKLTALGLVEAISGAPPSSARGKTVYKPTEKGRGALRQALVSGDWVSRRIAQPFATWLGLSIHLEAYQTLLKLTERKSFLEAELARETASLDYIETLTSDRARAGRKIVQLIIAQIQAELNWLRDLMAECNNNTKVL